MREVFVPLVSQRFKKVIKRNLYLLKDICKLAQNVFLQALECGDAAGERQSREMHSHIWNDPEVKHGRKKKALAFPGITFSLSKKTHFPLFSPFNTMRPELWYKLQQSRMKINIRPPESTSQTAASYMSSSYRFDTSMLSFCSTASATVAHYRLYKIKPAKCLSKSKRKQRGWTKARISSEHLLCLSLFPLIFHTLLQ